MENLVSSPQTLPSHRRNSLVKQVKFIGLVQFATVSPQHFIPNQLKIAKCTDTRAVEIEIFVDVKEVPHND